MLRSLICLFYNSGWGHGLTDESFEKVKSIICQVMVSALTGAKEVKIFISPVNIFQKALYTH